MGRQFLIYFVLNMYDKTKFHTKLIYSRKLPEKIIAIVFGLKYKFDGFQHVKNQYPISHICTNTVKFRR